MHEYYSYNMGHLRSEFGQVYTKEQEEINHGRDDKLKEITNMYKKLMSLAQEHITKGSNFKVGDLDEQQVMEEFEKQSEVYEQIVRESNLAK